MSPVNQILHAFVRFTLVVYPLAGLTKPLLVIIWFLFGEVSSSGCLGWAALFLFETPWAFHIIILVSVSVLFSSSRFLARFRKLGGHLLGRIRLIICSLCIMSICNFDCCFEGRTDFDCASSGHRLPFTYQYWKYISEPQLKIFFFDSCLTSR